MRKVLGSGITILVALATVLILPNFSGIGSHAAQAARIGGDLNMVAWEGYADSSFVKPFQQ